MSSTAQHGIKSEVKEVSPAMAEKMLAGNTINRTIRKRMIDRYAQDMKAGNWRLNGEPIIMSGSGKLLDGQHRLLAVIKSGVNVSMLVVSGVSEDSFSSIDSGTTRTNGDMLGILGYKSPGHLAAAAGILWRHLNKIPQSVSLAATREQILDIVSTYPLLADSVVRTGTLSKTLTIPKSVVGFFHFMASQDDEMLCDQFIEQLTSGVGLTENDPALHLRRKFIQNATAIGKLKSYEVLGFIIKGWNAVYEGREMKILRWRPQEEGFPEFASKSSIKRVKKSIKTVVVAEA